MADEFISSLAQQIYAQSRAQAIPGGDAAPEPEGSLVGGLLDVGENALMGALDFLDRPGRAARHLLFEGDVGQALEAFDPFNLLTEQESRPYFSADWLEKHGVPEGFHVPVIGSARIIGGFFLDILTDPLTLAGGW